MGCRQAKHSGLGVASLAQRGHRPDFDKAKPHGFPCINAACILVQTGSQPHAVGKAEPSQGNGVLNACLLVSMPPDIVLGACQDVDGVLMHSLRIKCKQQGANKGVGQQGHG